jgi:hypothetical protein
MNTPRLYTHVIGNNQSLCSPIQGRMLKCHQACDLFASLFGISVSRGSIYGGLGFSLSSPPPPPKQQQQRSPKTAIKTHQNLDNSIWC